MSAFNIASSSTRPAWNQVDSQDEMDGTDDEESIFRNMSFEDVLEELIARFMVNLPREETTPVRLYWQAEQAHWFYDDYLRPLNPSLQPLSQKHFTKVIISSSPLYANLVDEDGEPIDYEKTWDRYTKYKRMVPTCGVILVNAQQTKTLVVKHFGAKAWSWPRGKINENESEVACAVRELEEETGYDCSRAIDPRAKCEVFISGQSSTMFFVTGVDENFQFVPRTRNEIEHCQWVKLKDLPTWGKKRQPKQGKGLTFFKVAPFVHALKHYLSTPKNDRSRHTSTLSQASLQGVVRNDASVPSSIHLNSIPAVSSHPITQPASTLDQLFANFITKQEEDLQRDGPGGDEDNKEGLERLFGNVSSIDHAKHEESEDDALARLLGAIGTSATPAPARQVSQQPDPGKARLLSVLNQKPAARNNQPVTHHPAPSSSQHQVEAPTPKPHKASLLAMLAPPTVSAPAPVQAPVKAPLHPPQPMHTSLPTTPRPASTGEGDINNRQKALLDLTFAGLGLDSGATSGHVEVPPLPTHHNNEYGAPIHTPPHMAPPNGGSRISPSQYQYRPPAPPAAFPPPTMGYYSGNAPANQQYGHGHTGGGPSPPRNRGAPPPPYDSHFAGPGPGPGQARHMPPVVPLQATHDYAIHPHAAASYARPPLPPANYGPSQTYRPPPPPQQPQQYMPQTFQPPYVPHQQQVYPHNAGPGGYQPPIQRPQHHLPGQYQAPPAPPPQGYMPAGQSQPGNGLGPHHAGPMHQPVPKSGPQTGMMLAMLNEGRGR